MELFNDLKVGISPLNADQVAQFNNTFLKSIFQQNRNRSIYTPFFDIALNHTFKSTYTSELNCNNMLCPLFFLPCIRYIETSNANLYTFEDKSQAFNEMTTQSQTILKELQANPAFNGEDIEKHNLR